MTIIHPDRPAGPSASFSRITASVRGRVVAVDGTRATLRMADGTLLERTFPTTPSVGDPVILATRHDGDEGGRPASAPPADHEAIYRLLGGRDVAPGELTRFSEKLTALAVRLAMATALGRESGGLIEELGRLAARIQAIAGRPDSPPGPAAELAETVRNAGLFLEARLCAGDDPDGDLKAELLRLLQVLRSLATSTADDGGGGNGRELLSTLGAHEKAARQMLDALTFRQGLALVHSEGETVVAVPVPLHGPFEGGELIIQRDVRSHAPGRPPAPPRIVLKLNLSALGSVRAELRAVDNRVSVGFQVTQEASLHTFRTGLPLLEQRLTGAGLSVQDIIAALKNDQDEAAPTVETARYRRTA